VDEKGHFYPLPSTALLGRGGEDAFSIGSELKSSIKTFGTLKLSSKVNLKLNFF
jgi:hypothetical protein